MNELTVIIPFFNEGDEVENTVKSIKQTAGDNVDILLINDCSTDEYDYRSFLYNYNIKFITNKKRMGVAQSRNIGVSLINTPYFILLDAHMRFYDNDWWLVLVKHLRSDDRAVYCFACQPINKAGEFLDNETGMGAQISLYGNEFTQILEPIWLRSTEADTGEIPCILGATYGMSKRYWEYLKGLSMLKYYGADETYLSLKVWLEGGRCILIKNIIAGHIFRSDAPPYELYWPHSIFNKLIISETLLPKDYNYYVHAQLYHLNPDAYTTALGELIKVKKDISELRNYYQSVFTKKFAAFKQINSRYSIEYESIPSIQPESQDDMKEIFKKVYNYLSQNHTKTIGLGIGGLGELIFMTEYASLYTPNELPHIKKLLHELLDGSTLKDYYFEKGVSGLAIGLNYLNRHFYEFDINEQFKELDERLCAVLNENIRKQHYSILTGACAITLYFLERGRNTQLNDYINILLKYINAYIFQNKSNLSQTILVEITYLLIKAHKQGFDTYDSLYQIGNILSRSENTKFLFQCVSAYCLLNIGEISGNDFTDIGYNTLIEMSHKREAVLLNVSTIGLLDGTSLLTFIFNSMYEKFKEKTFKEAYIYWKQETLIRIISTLKMEASLNEIQKSFLYGISGAAFICLKY